ncbi:MAG: HAD family phosphatase [Desulfobacter sp.]|nr:MAG: HAD family phosphatase [Desulfobacter sp.]
MKAALFDLDGVLIDSELDRIQTYSRLLENEFGLSVSLEPSQFIGCSEEKNVSLILDKLGLKGDAQKLIKARRQLLLDVAARAPLIDDCVSLAKKLIENQISVAIATNSYGRYVEIVIERLGFHQQALVMGNQVLRPKPDPEIFLRAAEKLEVASRECLVFEDSPSGCLAAESAGMSCVLIRHRYNKGFSNKNIIGQIDIGSKVPDAIWDLFS